VNELVKPADNTLELVHEWLLDHGIERHMLEYSPARDWIKVSLPVKSVELLLDTKYSVFRHKDGEYAVRAPNWSLPRHLHDHIETIQPTTAFLRPKEKKRTPAFKKRATTLKETGDASVSLSDIALAQNPPSGASVAQVCNISNVTPLCLRTLYGILDYTPQVPGQNQIGFNDFLGEINLRTDAELFLSQYRPDAVSSAFTFTQISIASGTLQQTPLTQQEANKSIGAEGALDMEDVLSLTYPTPLTVYSTGGSPPFIPDALTPTDTNEPYLVWVQYALAQSSLPQVISTSYGDDEQSVPASYAKQVCSMFAQLGAKGVSLIFSSGDNGVGRNGTCISNDGTNTSTFLPAFPASCPYVTTVGATQHFSPEIVAVDVVNGFVSGGGFSNYFARPSYQDAVVEGYLANTLGNEFEGLYNPDGRAYPDVSAQGEHYVLIENGTAKHVDGTSASSPTFASIMSLVNDARLAKGEPPLGFLNPWLYSEGYKAFTDVTIGSAIGCNGSGFPAAPGWDPVTGFGSPVSRSTQWYRHIY